MTLAPVVVAPPCTPLCPMWVCLPPSPPSPTTARVTDQGFALLAGLPHLQTLWVDCCKLGSPVLMSLACSQQLSLLEVHRSHPEAPGLTAQQLQLLSRVKGARLEVVLREGHRPREELMRSRESGQQAAGGGGGQEEQQQLGGGMLAGGCWGGLGAGGTMLGSGTEVVLLDAGALRVMGSGVMAAAGDAGGVQMGLDWQPDWLPDLGGLHI